MAVDLKRVEGYIKLGFDKEEALKMVKEEEAEEPKESKEPKEPEEYKAIEELKKEIEELKKKPEDSEKKLEVDNKNEKPMTTEEAFKNIFLG